MCHPSVAYRNQAQKRQGVAYTYGLRTLSGESAGFEQIGNLFRTSYESKCKTVFVDCSRLSWIDAHLSAGYAAVQQLLRNDNIDLHFINMAPGVAGILEHHGLLGPRPAYVKESVIPLTRFSPGDAKKFAQYTQDNLTRLPIPEMSEEVSEKFFEGIDELFSNSELHSKTQLGMFACGQFFPRKHKLDFTLVDTGLGFQEVIRRSLQKTLSPDAAINWAMSGKNTTRSGDIPGGLGLKILKKFVEFNQGKLTVVSHEGYWCLCPKGITMGNIKSPFPGTAVTLEINTADRNKYYMSKPKNDESNESA